MAVILSALLVSPVSAQSNTMGLHGITYHSPGIDCDNGKNPGAYVRLDFGLLVGFYHNSCERQSEYLGYHTPEWRGLSLVFMGVTGYVQPVTPLAFPTYAARVYEDLKLRVSGASWDGRTVVHLSVERNF